MHFLYFGAWWNFNEFVRLVFFRIMVLSSGKIVEFDSPSLLLEKKGVFYDMAKDAKLV